jgi:DNA-binding transcriptional ArsR family regulator
MDKLSLLIHPIRLRIVTTISDGRKTARQVAAAMPDVPQSSLYRHLNLLLEGGMLQVVEEIPVRGTVEKVYALVEERINITAEDYASLTTDDLINGVNLIITNLMGDFQRSAAQYHPEAMSYEDLILFHSAMTLTPEQREAFGKDLNEVFLRHCNPPGQEAETTSRHYSGLIMLFPTAQPSSED